MLGTSEAMAWVPMGSRPADLEMDFPVSMCWHRWETTPSPQETPGVLRLRQLWAEVVSRHAEVASRDVTAVRVHASDAFSDCWDTSRQFRVKASRYSGVGPVVTDALDSYERVQQVVARAETLGLVALARHAVTLREEVAAWVRSASAREMFGGLLAQAFHPYSRFLSDIWSLEAVLRVRERDRRFELARCALIGDTEEEIELPPKRPELDVGIPDGPTRALPRETRAGPANDGTTSGSELPPGANDAGPDGCARTHGARG
jgi:hypothetical protein